MALVTLLYIVKGSEVKQLRPSLGPVLKLVLLEVFLTLRVRVTAACHPAPMISRGIPLRATAFFVFIILLISYNSMPYCVKDCNRNFANDAALSRHRKACPVLKIVRQHSQDIRRDKRIGGSIQDATTLPLTRKERLQVDDCSAFNLKVFY